MPEIADKDTVEIIEAELIEEKYEIMLSKEKAEELTKSIQSTTTALYILVKKAHDEKAWSAMGYSSWTEYIENEFNFSRARSYQLINQAKVIEELSNASGVDMFISEREARSIKNRLPEITKKITSKVKDLDEEDTYKVAKEVIDESKEFDRAKNFNNSGDSGEKFDDGYTEDTSSSFGGEWKPEGADDGKLEKAFLSKEDWSFFDNLSATLKIFEHLPEASEFGKKLKGSKIDKKDFLNKAEKAYAWLTVIIEEIE